MGLKRNLSFSSGELDPVLHDRVTLEKFGKGLATALNTIIGKSGSIMSRFGRAFFKLGKTADSAIKIFSPPNSSKFLEFGVDGSADGYIRIYDFDGTLDAEFTDATDGYFGITATTIPLLHFTSSGDYVYFTAFEGGTLLGKVLYNAVTPTIEYITNIFDIPTAPTNLVVVAVGAPAGYAVDYAITRVVNGEESDLIEIVTGAPQLPIAAGESNTITARLLTSSLDDSDINEMRVYRRPNLGGAYGFIGTSTYFYDDGSGNLVSDFEDVGFAADFTNGVPSIITKNGLDGTDPSGLITATTAIYQQRLLLGNFYTKDGEGILASRPGYQNNFYKDFPYDADSALLFKAGTSGTATVLRLVDSDGLIVFTTVGVFVNTGTLSINNLALEKKGSWLIKQEIPPLLIPGGLFFVEKDTNIIRQLIFQQDTFRYETVDHTIFSNHLFEEKTITSWAYQDGVTPMIIVTLSDGTWASFTYHAEHRMRAWTRHKSTYLVEQVEGTGIADTSFFVINKDGERQIEVSLPRKVPADTATTNPEFDKLNFNALMDGIESTSTLMNDSLVGANVFQLALISGDWADVNTLTLTCGTSALFPDPGLGAVGTIFRHFSTVDRTAVDLEVTARASDNSVTVQPSAEFPSAQAVEFRLYETFDTVTGLDHLEGESISLLVDGFVLASPNNDVDNYDVVTVSSGSITLPESIRGAIIIAGRPVTADVKTLNISTVEQKPTQIESLTVNKLYIRVHNTRGLHVSNEFPEESDGEVDGTSVDGMEDMDIFDDPDGYDIIGNRYKQPDSKRIEKTIPGNWDSQGQMAIRQVDPVHFEILSIIPDVEVLHRRG